MNNTEQFQYGKSFLIVLHRKQPNNYLIQNSKNNAELLYYPVNIFSDRIELLVDTRKPYDQSLLRGRVKLLFGDDLELTDFEPGQSMGCASVIDIDFDSQKIKVVSSIIGLPPIFYYLNESFVVLTSDLYLLNFLYGLNIEFEPASVVDLCRVGHTTQNKTLFKNVFMLHGGCSLSWDSFNNDIKIDEVWAFPEKEAVYSWDDYLELQIDHFNKAMCKIDLNDTFLSLTAGLDTRTVLASALLNQKPIPSAFTITGERLSLDAKIAKKLADSYRFDFEAITLDNDFTNNLNDHCNKASLLSGGLYSIGQAHEVYFYEKIGRSFNGRLSGNLGNQIGRGGTEGSSMRGVDLSILNPDFLVDMDPDYLVGHWFDRMKKDVGGVAYDSLLQDEIPNSSVGNFCIGHHYSTQKSPYAYRPLMEALSLQPQAQTSDKTHVFMMKLDDLKHRFLGQPEERSFQRKLINMQGGYVSNCPINWGWRSRGGMSAAGVLLGAGATLDALIYQKGLSSRPVRFITKLLGINGLHIYNYTNEWIKEKFSDYFLSGDCFLGVEEYLDKKNSEKKIRDFFIRNNMNSLNDICFIFDLCSAARNFLNQKK